MNQVDVVEVAGPRVKFTVTQRHPDAVGMSVVMEEDLLKVVAVKAFGLNEEYKPVPTSPLGHELGNDEVLYEGAGPELFPRYFKLVDSTIVRERYDDAEIGAELVKKGLDRASAEFDKQYYAEVDARRGLMHLTVEALDPRWVEHLKAGDRFEI